VRHPTAIYTLGLDFGGGAQPPTPRAAIICNAGNEADALADQLGKLAAIAQGARSRSAASRMARW